MTTLERIRHDIAPEIDALHARIDAALSCSNPLMEKVIKGYLQSKGKLIRPILVVLTAKLFGEVNERVIAAAAAVEMLHNASLIHDDVVDESKLRRGRPTLNSIWDNHIAVLTGDFFVSSALQQAISTGDIRIIDSLAGLGRRLSLGEIDQIYNARYHCLDEQAYFSVISSKTASLFVSCVEMGAYAVSAPDSALPSLRRFAELLGLCFQIKDDVFDYYSDERIGKPTGNDLREGKITLPLLYALTASNHRDAEAMRALADAEELSTEQINTLISFAKEAGGIDYAYATMRRLAVEARAIIAPFGQSSAADALDSILTYIIERDR